MESFRKMVLNPDEPIFASTYCDSPTIFDPDSLDAIKYSLMRQATDYERLVLGRWGSSDPLFQDVFQMSDKVGEQMPHDIELVLTFDYSNDNQFVPPSVEQAGLVEIDPTHGSEIAKYGGWFTAWGKELTGIDPFQKGAFALKGDWVFCKKDVTMMDHPDHKGSLVPGEITVYASLKHNYPNSPVVFAFALDGLRYCTLIHKKNAHSAVNFPVVFTTDDLVGDWKAARVSFKGAQIPFPANGQWLKAPGIQKGRQPLYQQALARNKVDVSVNLKVSPDLCVGFGVLDSVAGWNAPNEIFAPIPVDQSPLTKDPSPVFKDMQNSGNANNGIVAMLSYAADNGLIMFDKQVASAPVQNSSFAQIPFGGKSPKNSGISGLSFDPPDGLELPDPPLGFSWALNIRGILFLEGHDNPGQPLWPWDVFDLQQYKDELDSRPNDAELRVQVERIEKLFGHMSDVGDGISMNSKIFGGSYE